MPLRRHTGQSEQVVDQCLHAACRILHAVEVIAALRWDSATVLGLEAISKCLNFAKRLLKVMRCDVGELLELSVGAGEFGALPAKRGFGTLPMGDVEQAGADSDDRACMVPDQRFVNLDAHLRSIPSAVGALERSQRLLTPEFLLHGILARRAFLGIDCGTQSTKALLVDAETEETLSIGRSAHALIERADGTREQQPDWWIDALIAATRSALASAEDVEVAGIGVSGQQHGLVCLGDDDRPVG